jgi:hypothetical protein
MMAIMRCSQCGETTNAACECGVAYVSAGEYAAQAIAAHPEKSSRAIAAEIGVDHKTVSAARARGENSPPEKRVGMDGKSYPAKRPPGEEPERDMDAELAANRAYLRSPEFTAVAVSRVVEFAKGYAKEMSVSQRREFLSQLRERLEL